MGKNFIPKYFLLKKATYFASENSSNNCSEESVIIEKKTRGCAANKKKLIRSNIRVPSTPPSDISSSNLIKVEYYLGVRNHDHFVILRFDCINTNRFSAQIMGSVSGCHLNPVVKVPLVIGSFPIRDELQQEEQITIPLPTFSSANEVVTDQQSSVLPNSGVPLSPVDQNTTSPAQNAPNQLPDDGN